MENWGAMRTHDLQKCHAIDEPHRKLNEKIQKQRSTYKMILFDQAHKQTKPIYAVGSQDSGYLWGRLGW